MADASNRTKLGEVVETARQRRLMEAAAPDLYEALTEAHRALMHYEWFANPASNWARDEHASLRSQVDAAIAKARGEA